MSKATTYLAIDFGGGSGRVIAGSPAADGRMQLTEIHRFVNGPVKRDGHLRWDFDMLCREMLEGLRKAAATCKGIKSIGIDTWGVDFGLIDADGHLCDMPLCYRDGSWTDAIATADAEIGNAELYRQSGLQPIAINSIYRLMWMQRAGFDFKGLRMLFMPDLFNYRLTGVAANEYTIASTSGLLDAAERTWNHSLMRRLGLPTHLLQPIVMPGHSFGPILPEIAEATGLPPETEVIAVGSHDTASAVNAIAATADASTAFLSSGTWSLLGIRLPGPVTSAQAARSGYANEGGNSGILFLQNITGLWILQQLVAQWSAEGKPHDYPTLIDMARHSECPALIDVDDHVFSQPGDMAEAIRRYCLSRGAKAPLTQGELVRCVLESLADRYGRGVREMAKVVDRDIRRLHIIGGGSRNELLNELTARATGLEVTAGPAEATALGNIATQHNRHH